MSLIYTLVTFILSYVIAWFGLGGKFKLRSGDRHILAWLLWDIIIHTTLEGPFTVISLLGSVKNSQSFLAAPWKEYGKADARWLVSDPTIVSLEIATVFFVTPMCLVLIYAICKKRYYRHFIQISVCICELYGGWMTFGPEIITGSQSLKTDNFIYLYVYLIFYNGIWVVVPGLLLCQSWSDLKTGFAGGQSGKNNQNASSISAKLPDAKKIDREIPSPKQSKAGKKRK